MATSFPKVQTTDRLINQIQDNVARAIQSVLTGPLSNASLLTSVSLVSGANVINHGLGRKLQGWIPVRVRASATIYDTQDSNSTPALTLQLTASADVTVDLIVF